MALETHLMLSQNADLQELAQIHIKKKNREENLQQNLHLSQTMTQWISGNTKQVWRKQS